MSELPRYDPERTYEWNYEHSPDVSAADAVEVLPIEGRWTFCGLPTASPLGVPAGPLLNGAWCLYYAALGFDVVTYKTVRSVSRACYPLPNLQPVDCGPLHSGNIELPASRQMDGSWAVSYGMPSKDPTDWIADVRRTRAALRPDQLLSVSVVGTVQDGWGIEELAADYAACAKLAQQAGADSVEVNFSCPNVATCDGQLYQNPAQAAAVARLVRQAIGPALPLLAKIGRVVEQNDTIALLDSLAEYVDALAMTNSIAAKVRDPAGQWLFDGEKRGICGAATRSASLDQVARFRDEIERQGLKVRLIGVGGAATAQHVQDYLDAGAEAVHLATAAMVNPAVASEIRRCWSGSR